MFIVPVNNWSGSDQKLITRKMTTPTRWNRNQLCKRFNWLVRVMLLYKHILTLVMRITYPVLTVIATCVKLIRSCLLRLSFKLCSCSFPGIIRSIRCEGQFTVSIASMYNVYGVKENLLSNSCPSDVIVLDKSLIELAPADTYNWRWHICTDIVKNAWICPD